MLTIIVIMLRLTEVVGRRPTTTAEEQNDDHKD